jgi:hypothetical protein
MNNSSRAMLLASNTELGQKVATLAFWRSEVENELRRIGKIDFKLMMDSGYDQIMMTVIDNA